MSQHATIHDLKKDAVANLKRLYQANVDAAEGFREAADNIESPSLSAAFVIWSQERSLQADDLAKILHLNGQEIDRNESWLAELHQAFLKLRAAVTSNDEYAVLAEAERGEDHIKRAYESVLKDTPGTAVNDVLLKQFAQVKSVHHKIRSLRDAEKS